MTKPLLEVKNLSIKYPIWGGILRHKVNEVCAVDDVSFKINVGETLGLVGESGCGKTTVAKSIVNIHRAMTPGVAQDGVHKKYINQIDFSTTRPCRALISPCRA